MFGIDPSAPAYEPFQPGLFAASSETKQDILAVAITAESMPAAVTMPTLQDLRQRVAGIAEVDPPEGFAGADPLHGGDAAMLTDLVRRQAAAGAGPP